MSYHINDRKVGPHPLSCFDRFLKLQSRIDGKDYIRYSSLMGGGCVNWLPEGFTMEPPFASFIYTEEEMNWPGWKNKNHLFRRLHDYPLTPDAPHCSESFAVPAKSSTPPKELDMIKQLQSLHPEILSLEQLLLCEINCDPVYVYDRFAQEIGSGVLFHADRHGFVVCRGIYAHHCKVIAAPVDDYGKAWVAIHWTDSDSIRQFRNTFSF